MGLYMSKSHSFFDKKTSGCIGCHFSSSTASAKKNNTTERKLQPATKRKNLPNPNPNNYRILKWIQIKNYLILEVQYLDCTNYEGVKILLYQNCTMADLEKQKSIDPHFCDNKKYHSPIARFIPTQKGWDMALKICNQ